MNHFFSTNKTLVLTENQVGGFKKINTMILLAVCLLTALLGNAQGISINQRSSLVLNGEVSLVVNNGSLNNNGAFSASTSTVKFTGHRDTLDAYIAGKNTTTFHNLSVNKSAFGIALKSTVEIINDLSVTGGNLFTDSNLILKSSKTLTARLSEVAAGSKIIGKAHIERYIPVKRAWRLVTAPVTNSNSIFNSWQNRGIYEKGIGTLVTGPKPTGANGNGLDVSAQNTTSLKGWNSTTQSFVNIANTHVAASPGKNGNSDNAGYFMFIRGDRNPANTNISNSNTTTISAIGEFQTGTQTFEASAKKNGYTLIGNPYASPVDFNKLKTTNLVNRFYVWDPTVNTLGSYVMMDDLNGDGEYVKSVIVSSNTQVIQSGQAFFVQTKDAGAASITFEEKAKSKANNNLVFRPETPAQPKGTGIGHIRTILNLVEADNSTLIADGAIAEFDTIYSKLINSDDAVKLGNVNENLAISRFNATLVAERRPALTPNDTLLFKLTNLVQRNYQLEFNVAGLDQPNLTGFLEDSYLKTSTPVSLSGVTKVNFTVNANAGSSAANRFKIIFEKIVTLPVTLTNVAAYQKSNNVSVEWKVENEINMEKYDVESSTNGTAFTKAATLLVSGTNNLSNNYQWLDVNPAQGNNFYRVKMYDRNGKISYSAIVKVNIGKKESGFAIYPNPVTGNVINLQVNNQPAGTYQLRLTNIAGQVLYTNNIKNAGGNSIQTLNTGSKLATGIYQLEITGPDNISQVKQVIAE